MQKQEEDGKEASREDSLLRGRILGWPSWSISCAEPRRAKVAPLLAR